MTPNVNPKERYLNLVVKLSGLPKSEFKHLSYAELRALKQSYRSILQVKNKYRKKKMKVGV